MGYLSGCCGTENGILNGRAEDSDRHRCVQRIFVFRLASYLKGVGIERSASSGAEVKNVWRRSAFMRKFLPGISRDIFYVLPNHESRQKSGEKSEKTRKIIIILLRELENRSRKRWQAESKFKVDFS
jgi:hypothetical protein